AATVWPLSSESSPERNRRSGVQACELKRQSPGDQKSFPKEGPKVKSASVLLLILICSLALATGTDSRAASHLDITIEVEPVAQAEERTADFTTLVKALEASDPNARATAACQLGKMHEAAGRAIPNLIKLLADNTPVDFNDCDSNGNNRNHFGDS